MVTLSSAGLISPALLLYVSLQGPRADFRPVDIPLRVDGHAFGRARPRGVFDRVGNERDHFPVLHAADSNASFPAGVIPRDGDRFGVGHVNVVALVDEDPAGTTELRPLFDEVAVPIESLNAVVVAIAHVQAPPRIEREGVRLIELSRAGARLSPSLDEGAVLREFQHLRLALPVSLRDENLARGRDDDVVRLEKVFGVDASSGLAERHKQLAVRTE